MVFVLSIDGKPLHPCKEATARHLCQQGRACRVKNTPFTIKLKFVVDGQGAPITLGVDPGYGCIGLSATTEHKVLFEAIAECRTDIVKLLTSRSTLRRSRRGRKTRYRAPRWRNRKASKQKGWISPSVAARLAYHFRLINDIIKLLPITDIVIETASFDIQKLRHPEIEGVEYQQGRLYQSNLRAYVYAKFGGKCAVCGKEISPGVKWSMHHIHMRKNGATDNPDEFALICTTCHEKPHAHDKGGTLEKLIPKFESASYRDSAFMNILRWRLYNTLVEKYGKDHVSCTYGYLTSNTRREHSLPKDHNVDARCISGHPDAEATGVYHITKHCVHNRKLHKEVPAKGGKRQAQQSARIVFGYRLNDRVRYNGELCYIHGKRTSGYFSIKYMDGSLANPAVSYKKLSLVEQAGNLSMVLAPPTR